MTSPTESDAVAPPSIDAEEMGFAIALFVAAANGNVSVPKTKPAGVHLSRSSEWSPDALVAGARSVLMDDEDQFGDEVPLTRAVAIIWQHYESDERRQAICSRLVAFYSLMVRSNGALLEPWMSQNEDDSGSVSLSSAIVEAVGTAPLGPNGQFVDSQFENVVRSLSKGKETSPRIIDVSHQAGSTMAPRSTAPIAVTDVVKELATHLFAFQMCAASVPNADGSPQFRVIDKLCESFSVLGGNRGMQPMLSRALLAACSTFPWLQNTRASENGTVEGLSNIIPAPSVQEAARCELAVLGSLVELLRCFVGDAVTQQFLRTIWPLASFHPVAHREEIDQ